MLAKNVNIEVVAISCIKTSGAPEQALFGRGRINISLVVLREVVKLYYTLTQCKGIFDYKHCGWNLVGGKNHRISQGRLQDVVGGIGINRL